MRRIILLLYTFSTVGILSAQSTQFEISGKDGLVSQSIIHSKDDIYISFLSDSLSIYTTYIARWNIISESIVWCKKIKVDNNLSIRPIKIVERTDGTFVLGATDYSTNNGFLNGNYTFIQFDKTGKIVTATRLGSDTGGELRDFMVDSKDQIVFVGERINIQSAYRTVLGRLDNTLSVINMRSVYKDFYTYGFALNKDSRGNIYTVGHTQPASFGLKKSMITKWDQNFNHISSVIQLDPDPNTTFNYIHIDKSDQVHLGGNLGNLVQYVRFDNNLNFQYGHEFFYAYIRNIWTDNDQSVHMFIDGVNNFAKLDQANTLSYKRQYINVGTTTSQTYDPKSDWVYNLSYLNTSDNPKNKILLNSNLLKNDDECFFRSQTGGANGPLRINSFGMTEVVVRNETMTAIKPDDLIFDDYKLTVKEICKIDRVSSFTNEAIQSSIVYPNPTHNYIYIKDHASISYPSRVNIFDANGRKLIGVSPISQDEKIDVSSLNNGMYSVQVIYEDGQTFVSKIVLSK